MKEIKKEQKKRTKTILIKEFLLRLFLYIINIKLTLTLNKQKRKEKEE